MIRFIQEEKEEKEMAGIEKFWNSAERKGSKGQNTGKKRDKFKVRPTISNCARRL